VNARLTAIAFAVLAIGLTLAQDILPARDWYHSWQYVVILAVAILVMTADAWQSARAAGDPRGKRIALALVGAIAVAVAGLLSGLIGPDTVTVVGTPGTVTPVADVGAAAFFAAADPLTLPRGDATITLRRRDGGPVEVGTRPVPIGLSVVFAQLRPAAYVVARNDRGDRLTITQPNNPSFLSPVMLFRQAQAIHGRTFPLDTFAVPAAHRVVRILYFSPADLAAFQREPSAPAPTQPGAILTASDDAGAQAGITMAASGHEVTVGGLHITVTLGTYPVLQVASAPQPFVVLAGLAVFLGALIWSQTVSRTAVPPAAAGSPPAREPAERITAAT
jgi:hypothetical protein